MNWKDAKKLINSDPEVIKALEENEEEYKIAKTVIKARIEKKITQRTLAQMIKTKQANISRLESGKYNPSVRFLNSVAKALGKKMVINFVDTDKDSNENKDKIMA